MMMMDRETWGFINSFAPWFSAIGTFSAVVVSLYFARKSSQARLKVSTGHRLIVERGRSDYKPEFVVFRVVNKGSREVKVTGIGWQSGFMKRRYGYQDTGNSPHSSKMPIMIGHGEEAIYYLELRKGEKWIEDFSEKFLLPHPRWALLSLKPYANTSIGTVAYGKVEDGLKEMFLKESLRQLKKKNGEP
jgi:hypothetical protein